MAEQPDPNAKNSPDHPWNKDPKRKAKKRKPWKVNPQLGKLADLADGEIESLREEPDEMDFGK